MRASKDLSDLVTGPSESVRWLAWDVSVLFRLVWLVFLELFN